MDNVKLNSTGADYDDKSLFKEFERVSFYEYTLSIINRVLHPKDGKRRNGILVFCRFVEDAESLAAQLDPVCEVVTGSTPKRERDDILKRFKSGEVRDWLRPPCTRHHHSCAPNDVACPLLSDGGQGDKTIPRQGGLGD